MRTAFLAIVSSMAAFMATPLIGQSRTGTEAENEQMARVAVLSGAVQAGDARLVHRLIATGTPVVPAIVTNTGSPDPLHIAAEFLDNDSFLEIASALLAAGARLDIQTPGWPGVENGSALSRAACRTHLVPMRFLLDRGAAVDARGDTPLLCAVMNDGEASLAAAKLLLDYGASVNAVDTDGRTPLMHARSPEMTRLLLDHGASIDARDKRGRTAIVHSIANERWPVLESLLERGADPNASDAGTLVREKNDTHAALLLYRLGARVDKDLVLIAALERGNLYLAQTLLADGANVNFVDPRGTTPLMVAHSADAVRMLLARGADPLLGKELPLTVSAGRRDWASFDLLLQAAPYTPEHLTTPIIFAARDEVRLAALLARGADPNANSTYGTPLQAAVHGCVKCVSLLIDAGANAGWMGSSGDTIMNAAYRAPRNQRGIVRLLDRALNVDRRRDREVVVAALKRVALQFDEYEVVDVRYDNGRVLSEAIRMEVSKGRRSRTRSGRGISVSRPAWVSSYQAVIRVTIEGSHSAAYVFERKEDHWVMKDMLGIWQF